MSGILDEVLAVLHKKYGEDSAQIGEDELESTVIGYLTTQCPMLDYVIGHPGVPIGRITTIVGHEGAGKSTLALHLLAETQRIGGIAVLADTEQRLWADRARDIGFDLDKAILLRPQTLEDAMGQVEDTIKSVREKAPDTPLTVAVDSIAGAPTKADMEMKYGDSLPAAHARLLSLAMRRVRPLVARTRTTLLLVNQLRHKIDFGGWGRPQMVMLGEKSINYSASLKIFLEASQKLVKDKDTAHPYGIRVSAKIAESRISPREGFGCTFDLNFRTGIDTIGSALDVLVEVGAIEFNKGWYTYGDTKFHRGDFPTVLDQHPELYDVVSAAPELWMEEILRAEEEA